jgi:hypothetical protein
LREIQPCKNRTLKSVTNIGVITGILVTCFGQPAGHDPLSFRSKICAFLAAVKLITLLIQYDDDLLSCNEKVRGKFQFFTDSLSMIKKLEAYSEYPTAPLKTVLHS